jgi:hypothetical protein
VPIAIFDVVLKGGQVTGNEEDGCTVQAEGHADTPLSPRVSANTVHNYGNNKDINKAERQRVEPRAPTLFPATPATPHASVPRRT